MGGVRCEEIGKRIHVVTTSHGRRACHSCVESPELYLVTDLVSYRLQSLGHTRRHIHTLTSRSRRSRYRPHAPLHAPPTCRLARVRVQRRPLRMGCCGGSARRRREQLAPAAGRFRHEPVPRPFHRP